MVRKFSFLLLSIFLVLLVAAGPASAADDVNKTATPTPTTATPTPTTATPTPTTATPTPTTATPTPTTATPTPTTATPTPTTATPTPTTATPTPTTATPTPTTATPTPTPTPGIGWYIVSCNVDGAEVYFDGVYKGSISGGTLSVEYRTDQTAYSKIRVSKSGYTTVTKNLPSPPGAGGKVNVYITLQSSPSASGTLNIYSTPSQGSVYIDKSYKGTTPFSISLSPGTYGVQVDKSGYMTTSETVILTSGQTVTRSYTLQPKNQYGSLIITSEPSNTYVYVDGVSQGRTPVTVNNLVVGNHNIRLTATGYYDWTTTQYVKAGEIMTVHGTLKSSSTNMGYIRVVSYPGEAEVYLNGNYMGTTNEEGTPGAYTMTVSPGTYKVSVELTGYQDSDQTVTVGSGQTLTVTAQLSPIASSLTGSIAVSTTPSGANVYLDNEYKGITPLTIQGVSSGNHDMLLRLQGYQDANDEVNVPAGGTATVSISMKTESDTKQSPGFSIITVIGALAATGILAYRKKHKF